MQHLNFHKIPLYSERHSFTEITAIGMCIVIEESAPDTHRADGIGGVVNLKTM
jgi:hypothetical protein